MGAPTCTQAYSGMFSTVQAVIALCWKRRKSPPTAESLLKRGTLTQRNVTHPNVWVNLRDTMLAKKKRPDTKEYVLHDVTYVKVTIVGLPSGDGGQMVGTSGCLWGPGWEGFWALECLDLSGRYMGGWFHSLSVPVV